MKTEEPLPKTGGVVHQVLPVVIGLILVCLSNAVGALLPPFSITVTPVLLPLIIGGLHYKLYKRHFYGAMIWGFALFLINDVLIRNYAGGIHDEEGRMWIFLHSVIAFCIIVLILLIYAVSMSRERDTRSESFLSQTLGVLVAGGITAFIYCAFITPL